jgi:hypothetical protein
MMKALFFSFFCLFSGMNLGFSQVNLVPNGDFESPAPGFTVAEPPCNDENEIFKAFPWKGSWSDMWNNSNMKGPKLFDTRSSLFGVVELCPFGNYGPTALVNEWGGQAPHSGNRYIGIGCGAFYTEVQLAFVHLTEPIFREDIVHLSLYVSQGDATEELSFDVYLSENDVYNDYDPEIYTGTANNKDSWVQHTATASLANLGDEDEYCAQYHYLIIKGHGNAFTSAMYIDDVSLTKEFDCASQHECLPRTGPVNLLFSKPHSSDFPFCVIGAENLSYINMQIRNAAGQQVIWEFEMEYPPNRICWDGRTTAGTTVAVGIYYYHVTADAFCTCSRTYDGDFYKQSESPPDDPDYYYNMPLNGCPRPVFCCGGENQSLDCDNCDISGNAEYKVRGAINVNSVVIAPNSNVSMQAGSRIELVNFSSGDGNGFIAEIVPCPNLRLSEETLENTEPEDLEILSKDGVESDIKPVTLYPNPTTGHLTLSHSQQLLTVEVYDPLGRQLQLTTPNTTTTRIDLSGQPAGIYIIRAGLEDGSTETIDYKQL